MALTKEQLAIRKVGGSDVATILGLNPYKTAVELYHEKRGTLDLIDLSGNIAVEAGNVLEDGIAELAAAHMSRAWGRTVKLRRSNLTLVHPDYDWITVHIDRDVVGEERGVEIKNVGAQAARNWGPQGTDEIPDYYLPQPHTYMLVKSYPVWTVAGYFGGADLRLYEVDRSKEWDDLIVERTHDFWNGVLEGVPPPIDLTDKAAERLVKRLYPGTDGTEQLCNSADLEHWFEVLRQAKAQIANYEMVEKGAMNHLLYAMKNSAVMEFPGGWKLTRKLVKRKGYVVEDTSYMQTKIMKPKGAKEEDE